jgi:cytochrome c-type biogenesis protein CcmH/NrfG
MQELYSNLHQAGTQLRSAAILSATDLEMQGRMGMAQLVQQNPESVVGWFQGLMSLLSANAAMTGNTRAGRQMQPSPRGNA